jgi:hypothetical protein
MDRECLWKFRCRTVIRLPSFNDKFRKFLREIRIILPEGSKRRTRAVRGVSSDGFMTIVQPTARAGATFQALKYRCMRSSHIQEAFS